MNNELKNIEIKNKTLDSREVAEMMGKKHGAVMKDIQGSKDGKTVGIVPVLLKYNFNLSDYFIESSYKDSSGKSNKYYLITYKGMAMLIHKQQGEKGIINMALLIENTNNIEYICEKYMLTESIRKDIKRKEIVFINKLEELLKAINITDGIKQYNVLNYKIDYYIPSLNIAIEYDENNHSGYTYEQHDGRQKEIENKLKCCFVRVTDENSDEYNIGLVLKKILKKKERCIVNE